MFEKLVESKGRSGRGRTGSMLLMTGLVYFVVMTAIGVATVFWFNPALAESSRVMTMLQPPLPPAPPQQQEIRRADVSPEAVSPGFITPQPPVNLIDPGTIPPASGPSLIPDYIVHGATGPAEGSNIGVPGGTRGDSTAPPPPPPTPRPTATPAPTPAPKQEITRVSEGVLQGRAVRKIRPDYPAIAKAARVQGTVQVQVLISEQGQVISATAISGHPLLREASVRASRQWMFEPTTLSNEPVRVQGILTFNFTLN